MPFIHEDAEFGDIISIVAANRGLARGLVEKDYWVIHTLWALTESGLDIWFKGGTSLSKGFGLIERFSEDLDLKIEPGRVEAIPTVVNWKNERKNAVDRRRAYFHALVNAIAIPGAAVLLANTDKACRSANLQVLYANTQLDDLPDVLKPFVLLEVGDARVTPFVSCTMTSFVHEHLESISLLADFQDNRPKSVRCVHPLVTLLEKLDALQRRLPREDSLPATFVRHFEDAARIILAERALPRLEGYAAVRVLAEELLAEKQITMLPDAIGPAFTPTDGNRWNDVRHAHAAIGPMFWGNRISIDDCCRTIREWIEKSIAR
jgi:hypothetical protein